MKKLLVAAAVLALPFAANAATLGTVSMSGTAHDLTATGPGPQTAQTDRICVFCHVPHNSSTTTNGIWNRALTTTDFTGWGSGSPTIAGTTLPTGANSIGGGSVRCFSCHDGSATLGVLLNSPTGADLTMTSTSVSGTHTLDPTAMAGNHPVSTPFAGSTYNTEISRADTTKYYDPATEIIPANTVKIYGGAGTYGIECGSCHEPHDTTFSYFLRADIAGSALCVNCHAK